VCSRKAWLAKKAGEMRQAQREGDLILCCNDWFVDHSTAQCCWFWPLKGYSTQKWKFAHHLLTLKLLQTCMSRHQCFFIIIIPGLWEDLNVGSNFLFYFIFFCRCTCFELTGLCAYCWQVWVSRFILPDPCSTFHVTMLLAGDLIKLTNNCSHWQTSRQLVHNALQIFTVLQQPRLPA